VSLRHNLLSMGDLLETQQETEIVSGSRLVRSFPDRWGGKPRLPPPSCLTSSRDCYRLERANSNQR